MSTVKSGIRIATADGRWFVHRLHGVCYASWVSAKDKEEAERFPLDRSQQWLENMKEVTGMDDLRLEAEDETVQPPVQHGWICPRCGKGNAPWQPTCPCMPTYWSCQVGFSSASLDYPNTVTTEQMK